MGGYEGEDRGEVEESKPEGDERLKMKLFVENGKKKQGDGGVCV